MIYTCQRCTKDFERQKKKAGYRFCSQKCANLRQIKLTADKLRPYAERGARAKTIAYDLNVHMLTVRRALQAYGLHTLWTSHRYKKCASPTVGPTSTTIASSEVTLPSAESVAQMAGGTNCGG